nr:putative disease resistance rpp8-like protein 4 [Quercus suber]
MSVPLLHKVSSLKGENPDLPCRLRTKPCGLGSPKRTKSLYWKISLQLIIDEGALPLLEKLEIGPSPLLKEVLFGIHHLKSLKTLKFWEIQTKFILSLPPDEGPDFGKVKHIPSIAFWYRTRGEDYIWYTLGNSNLLKRL